jgi:hypothetical protein
MKRRCEGGSRVKWIGDDAATINAFSIHVKTVSALTNGKLSLSCYQKLDRFDMSPWRTNLSARSDSPQSPPIRQLPQIQYCQPCGPAVPLSRHSDVSPQYVIAPQYRGSPQSVIAPQSRDSHPFLEDGEFGDVSCSHLVDELKYSRLATCEISCAFHGIWCLFPHNSVCVQGKLFPVVSLLRPDSYDAFLSCVCIPESITVICSEYFAGSHSSPTVAFEAIFHLVLLGHAGRFDMFQFQLRLKFSGIAVLIHVILFLSLYSIQDHHCLELCLIHSCSIPP